VANENNFDIWLFIYIFHQIAIAASFHLFATVSWWICFYHDRSKQWQLPEVKVRSFCKILNHNFLWSFISKSLKIVLFINLNIHDNPVKFYHRNERMKIKQQQFSIWRKKRNCIRKSTDEVDELIYFIFQFETNRSEKKKYIYIYPID